MGRQVEAGGLSALPGGERLMLREIVEIGVVLGLAVGGVAVAIYNHEMKALTPNIVHVVPVPVETPAPPPPPAPTVVEVEAGSAEAVSQEGETPLQKPPRSPQDIVIPPPRSIQAIDKIEDRLLQIQQRIDRIEKKAIEVERK
jgi:hypothetical protein